MPKHHRVRLSDADRHALQRLVRSGEAPARALTHARILLKADEGAGGPGWQDVRIAAALETSASTVERVRKRYAAEGLQAALHHRPPRTAKPRKLDGHAEALHHRGCPRPTETTLSHSLNLLWRSTRAVSSVN
jgi:hypothetical protein